MKGKVITLGNFDGVHLGHSALLEKAIAIGNQENLPTLAITYHPHPAIVLSKKHQFSYLQSLKEREETILASGIESLEVLPFTVELSEMEAEDFLETYLIDRYQAKHIIIGFNHCFGKNRRGNFDLLERLSGKYGFSVYEVEPVFSDGEKISSSLIRKYLSEGNLPKANSCLGRNFSISGQVVHGEKIGRTMDSPTANLLIPEGLVIPMNGVYATLTNGKPSVTNVGTKPTFDIDNPTIETHIMDWHGNLYNKEVKVEFIKKLRNIAKFIGPDDLKDQIQKDIEEAKKILTSYEKF